MDRYIVHSNDSGQNADQAAEQNKALASVSNSNNGVTNEPQSTFIIHPGPSKILESTTTYKLDNGDNDYEKAMETETQFTAKQLDTSQFNEGVSNTTYIIDNNSSNSIDSVRIGNHSFVPVVDSSLYNISVAGSTAQYTIEGVVNPSLGNYIIEAPAYIVEAKPAQTHATHTMYIQQPQETQLQPQPPQQTIQAQVQDVKKDKAKKPAEKKPKKAKEPETGPFFCNICSAEFNSSASLRFHSYHHNPKNKRFSCIGCEKAFEKDKEKEEHELSCDVNYTNNKFNCIFCDLPFSFPKSLRNHENKHRPVKKTKKYKHMCVCIKCNKAFDAIYTLKVHIKKIHGGNASADKKKKKKKEVDATVIQELKFESNF